MTKQVNHEHLEPTGHVENVSEGSSENVHPEPMPFLDELPPVLQLTDKMIPNLINDYVKNQAERLNVSQEYIVIPLLISLGSLCGTKVRIKPKKEDKAWEITANNFGAIVGEPSSRKSPAISAGLYPFQKVTKLAIENFQLDKLIEKVDKEIGGIKYYATDDSLSNATDDSLSNSTGDSLSNATDDSLDDSTNNTTDDETMVEAMADICMGLNPIEGLKNRLSCLNEEQLNNPILLRKLAKGVLKYFENIDSEVKLRIYKSNDATVEKTGEILSENTNGILLIRDELIGLLQSLHGEENAPKRAFFLESFNGLDEHIVDRIGRGRIKIKHNCLSIIGGIQPKPLEKELEKNFVKGSNDGFMQRMQLIVYPDELDDDNEPDIAVNEDVRKKIVDILIKIDEYTPVRLMDIGAKLSENDEYAYFDYDEKAYRRFMDWMKELRIKTKSAQPIIQQHLGKTPKTLCSLSMMFHMIDCFENETAGDVSLSSLEMAIEFTNFLETHMYRVYHPVLQENIVKAKVLGQNLIKVLTEQKSNADKIFIQDGFSESMISRRGWGEFGNDRNSIKVAITILEKLQWIQRFEKNSGDKGGRPTTKFFINPRIVELF